MQVLRLPVTRDALTEQEPMLRISLDGGCDRAGCNCSPEPFVLISDGEVMLTVTLTKEEAARAKASGYVEVM